MLFLLQKYKKSCEVCTIERRKQKKVRIFVNESVFHVSIYMNREPKKEVMTRKTFAPNKKKDFTIKTNERQ